MPKRKSPETLRSHAWFGSQSAECSDGDLRGFSHRSRMSQLGYDPKEYQGRPIIGILNTWNDIMSCHQHFKQRVDDIKRGVLQAGGLALEIPVMALSEPFQKPSTMLYRNLLSLEAEEIMRSYPVDGVVLMAGCDKTTPALVMAAANVDIPTIVMPAGPMLTGSFRGEPAGSGTDKVRWYNEYKAQNISAEQWMEFEQSIARSPGHCMTMGTASTMTAVSEVLGLTLPGASSIPAVDSRHAKMAAETGRRIVDMTWSDICPSDIITEKSMHNAVVTVLSLGGSTNAVIHLTAIARRFGIELPIDRFNDLSWRTPILANLKPHGKYVMEDFFQAGGLPALLQEIKDLLHTDQLTCNGRTLGENIAGNKIWNTDVIRSRSNAVSDQGGIVVLYGNLAPRGAVIKTSAVSEHFYFHRGHALVFENNEDLKNRINDPDLPVNADTVLILKNSGPVGGPGMPEWGHIPIPEKLLKQGIRDMVRISDARMSGTSFGTCVLHVCPESAIGGPLAAVKNGDLIELDIHAKKISLLISDEEMSNRLLSSPTIMPGISGYMQLYRDHVLQADEGCDFDFLSQRLP